MRDEIILYPEACQREGRGSLQQGMHYRADTGYSVVVMSRRRNAPYQDRILEDGKTMEYEGHDATKRAGMGAPKDSDQPRYLKSGKPTQNGLFAAAVDAHQERTAQPRLVRVYEKILRGVWSEKGFFLLVDYKVVSDGRRNVFKFYLEATDRDVGQDQAGVLAHSRLIPSEVKKEVWKRDKGMCQLCGAKDNLHFDHDIPFSKGGSSITADNVRILCARHNIQKSDKIE